MRLAKLLQLIPKTWLRTLLQIYLNKLKDDVKSQRTLDELLIEINKLVPKAIEHPNIHGDEARTLSTDFRYTDRHTKGEYIFRKYEAILSGSVLDVGCDQAPLRTFLTQKGIAYVGIDISGAPDIKVNLERGGLPFVNRSFYTVVCTDVLEHLEQIHLICDEICRVAQKYVIISLPNNWYSFLVSFLQNDIWLRDKFYGLPLDKPTDRHRWFFGYSQAQSFLAEHASRNGFSVVQIEPEHIGTLVEIESLPQTWRQAFSGIDFSYGTLWCVLERTNS